MATKKREKKASALRPWHERLDEAVAKNFQGVKCETRFDFLGTLSYVSRWSDNTGKKLKPALARQVKAFVAGFMAAEEAHL